LAKATPFLPNGNGDAQRLSHQGLIVDSNGGAAVSQKIRFIEVWKSFWSRRPGSSHRKGRRKDPDSGVRRSTALREHYAGSEPCRTIESKFG
jgi:hypothetical protein